MIAVENLHFRHSHAQSSVLKGISLSAVPGTITAILGPNGSGKTTLFKCISGLWKPQLGDIAFQGKTIRGYSHAKIAKIIAVVPQDHGSPFPYSVYDAVLIGRTAHVGMFSTPTRLDRRKAEQAMEQVGIDHMKDRLYTRISGGERQLVLIARALAQESPVVLLDEPTSHLDFRNQVQVLSKLKDIVRQKSVTALMTIHDPNLAALFSDSVVMIKDGRVLAQGSADEIVNEGNLSTMYDLAVSVFLIDGSRVILPRLDAS